MTKYSTVFFDWGGVIANDPGDDFLHQLLIKVGASQAQIQEIFQTYMHDFMRGKISEQQYWQQLKSKYGLQIHDSISEAFMEWRGLVANQDILALAEEARAAGLQIAILSNVIEPTYNAIAKAGYYDRFDGVIASCKVGYAKPEQPIYELALQSLGTTAEQSLFIDDKQYCLDPAAAMGFTTVLAQSPQQIIHDVRKLIEK